MLCPYSIYSSCRVGGELFCQCRLVKLKRRTHLVGLFHAPAARVMQAGPTGPLAFQTSRTQDKCKYPTYPRPTASPTEENNESQKQKHGLGYSGAHFCSTVRCLIKASSSREGYWQPAARLAPRPRAGFEQFTLHLRFVTLFPRQALIRSLCCGVRHLSCTQLKPLFLLLASKSHIAFTQTLLPSTMLPN